jgi:hypothetical protein
MRAKIRRFLRWIRLPGRFWPQWVQRGPIYAEDIECDSIQAIQIKGDGFLIERIRRPE